MGLRMLNYCSTRAMFFLLQLWYSCSPSCSRYLLQLPRPIQKKQLLPQYCACVQTWSTLSIFSPFYEWPQRTVLAQCTRYVRQPRAIFMRDIAGVTVYMFHLSRVTSYVIPSSRLDDHEVWHLRCTYKVKYSMIDYMPLSRFRTFSRLPSVFHHNLNHRIPAILVATRPYFTLCFIISNRSVHLATVPSKGISRRSAHRQSKF
ncbi:hypothetical protein C8Q73DRAFT_347953 [Cubamyces lactineus]|nr:hypothetical protein C8Q73DRAFT_347953 [Cubamyces lactineus]